MNTIFEVERELLIKQIPYSLFAKDRYIELESYKYGRIRITETVSLNKFSVIRNNDVLVSLGTLKEVIDFTSFLYEAYAFDILHNICLFLNDLLCS